WQFILNAQAPGPDRRILAFGVDGDKIDREAQPAVIHEVRAQVIQVARRQLRREEHRRIAEAVEVSVVLAFALEELTEAAAYRRPTVAVEVPREAEARRDLILAVLDAARRNAVSLLDESVERVAGAGNDRAFGRPVGRLNAHRFGRIVLVH